MGTALIAILIIGFVSFFYLVSDLTSSATPQKQTKLPAKNSRKKQKVSKKSTHIALK